MPAWEATDSRCAANVVRVSISPNTGPGRRTVRPPIRPGASAGRRPDRDPALRRAAPSACPRGTGSPAGAKVAGVAGGPCERGARRAVPSFLNALERNEETQHDDRDQPGLPAHRCAARAQAGAGTLLAPRHRRRATAGHRTRAAPAPLATATRGRGGRAAQQRLQPVRRDARHRVPVRCDPATLPRAGRCRSAGRLLRDGARHAGARPGPACAGNDQVVRHQLPLPGAGAGAAPALPPARRQAGGGVPGSQGAGHPDPAGADRAGDLPGAVQDRGRQRSLGAAGQPAAGVRRTAAAPACSRCRLGATRRTGAGTGPGRGRTRRLSPRL